MKITDRIKTFQDVLDYIGEEKAQEFYNFCKGCSDHNIVDKQVELLCKVLNEGWVATEFNTSQYKCIPYFARVNYTLVGRNYPDYSLFKTMQLRHCFKNNELATYAGKQFISLYNKLLSL